MIPPRPLKPYYSEGGITIYHGDCRTILPRLGKFDLLLTDPPYGIGASGLNFISGTNTKKPSKKTIAAMRPNLKDYYAQDKKWDSAPPSRELMDLIFNFCEKGIVWGGNYFNCPPSRCWLIWNKHVAVDNYADAELAWTNFNHLVKIFDKKWTGSTAREKHEIRSHPTQKPVSLIQWCIQVSEKKTKTETIIDPFTGSGTTLVAAKALGKHAVGIELDEQYCEIAALRLSQEIMQLK